ncbi:trace amine-associated receptor 1-like [Nerophis lumbriciformis]|uniref:trace amine-associated receptor 1-like n=1 Tax=Nerophis lumbriciformis TaxID=546530 RepID=UPI003BAA3389
MTVNKTIVFDDIHPCYTLDNTTYIFTSHPSVVCVTLYVFLGFLSVCTICGNLLVIIAVVSFRQLHSPTNYLILSLAVADLLVGFVVFPFSMGFSMFSCWHHGGLFCKIRSTFDVTLSTASILNLCCISVDRYHAVCQPLTYKSKISHRVVGAMILVNWGFSVLIGISVTVAGFNQGKCEDSCLMDALIQIFLGCIFPFYIPVLIMLSIYLRIFIVAQRQVRIIHNSKSGSVSKMERKATKTLSTVMGVFILCWTPFITCIALQPFTFHITPVAVLETLNWLTLSNSMLNPFIYAFFYSWFRTAFRLIMAGKIFQAGFTNTKLF